MVVRRYSIEARHWCTYEDLTGALAAELDLDRGRTKVGRHREIRHGKGGEDDDCELVEEPGTPGPL